VARYVSAKSFVYFPDLTIPVKAFLDYAHIMTRLPELQAQIADTEAVPDASQATELDELTRSIPKLIEILPDVLRNRDDPRHNAALAEMTAGLMSRLDKVKPLALVCFCSCQQVLILIQSAVTVTSQADIRGRCDQAAAHSFDGL
jgi:hypothetical protein